VAGDFPGEVSSFSDCPADNWAMFKPSGGCEAFDGANPPGSGMGAELGN
jgi:hypothetical protein